MLVVLQVVTQTGEEVFFKIKRNTKLSKLQGAYANKVGKDVSSIRYVPIYSTSHFYVPSRGMRCCSESMLSPNERGVGWKEIAVLLSERTGEAVVGSSLTSLDMLAAGFCMTVRGSRTTTHQHRSRWMTTVR